MSVRIVTQLLLSFSLFIAAPLTAYAETMWLSDVLWVNVRTGPGGEYRSLKTIKSGTRMEILEKNEEADYYRVRTENGLEGWVPKRYLDAEPTGQIQAINLTAEKQQLQQQYDALDEKYKALLANKGDVSGELETLRTDNASLTKELNRIKAISENAINLDSEYQALAEENARIKNELDVMTAENQRQREFNDSQMLTIGAILIVIGIVLGVILPRLTGNKRRRDGWS